MVKLWDPLSELGNKRWAQPIFLEINGQEREGELYV